MIENPLVTSKVKKKKEKENFESHVILSLIYKCNVIHKSPANKTNSILLQAFYSNKDESKNNLNIKMNEIKKNIKKKKKT